MSGISCKGETCPHIDLEVFHKNVPRLPTECCLVLELHFMHYYWQWKKKKILLAKFVTFCLLTQNILQTSFLTLHLFPNWICFQYLFISQKRSHSSTLLSSIIFFQLYKAIDRKGRASNRTCIKKKVMLYLFFSILMILWPFMRGNHFMFFSSFDSFNVCDYKVGRARVG